jgi:glycosyltransferase involved in cell wall biosynthesis
MEREALPERLGASLRHRHEVNRILHLIGSADPREGGPIEGVIQLLRIQQDEGRTVELVSCDSPDDPWVRNRDFKIHALGPAFGRYGFSLRLLRWLRQNAQRFDAVIVNGLWQFHGLATRWALQRTQTPYFVYVHGMLDPWFKQAYPFKHLKKWLYWPLAEYRVLRDAKAVLFTSEEERRLARHSFWLYRCHEKVVGYGTAAFSGNPEGVREEFLAEYPDLKGTEIVLFLGRIHGKKGVDLLLRAFARHAPADTNVRLVIAGPDSNGTRRELEMLAESLGIAHVVTWPGMLTGDLKWGALHVADVFILPSHQENFGIAVAEALACGVPVLISNRVNTWREIDAGGAGYVEPDTQTGTDALLARWRNTSTEARQQMRKNARECFARHFDIRAAAKRLTHVLSETAKEGQ